MRRAVHARRFSPSGGVTALPVTCKWNRERPDCSTSYLHFSICLLRNHLNSCTFSPTLVSANFSWVNPSISCFFSRPYFAAKPTFHALIGWNSFYVATTRISGRFDIQFCVCDSIRGIGILLASLRGFSSVPEWIRVSPRFRGGWNRIVWARLKGHEISSAFSQILKEWTVIPMRDRPLFMVEFGVSLIVSISLCAPPVHFQLCCATRSTQ